MTGLSKAQNEKLAIFTKLLQMWNKTHKLTSDISLEAIDKNIEDSLYPTCFIKAPKNVADIGTGAGYPGLILAVFYMETAFTLFEPLGKKASFLLNCAIEMELKNVQVIQERVEDYKTDKTFDLITSRAVDVPQNILILSKNITDQNSRFLLYTGEDRGEMEMRKLLKKETRGRRIYLYF